MNAPIDFLVAMMREQMEARDYARLGEVEESPATSGLCKALAEAGVMVEYELDHNLDASETEDDPGPKALFAFIPRWCSVAIRVASQAGYSAVPAIKTLVGHADRQAALLTSFDCGGIRAASAFLYILYEGEIDVRKPYG